MHIEQNKYNQNISLLLALVLSIPLLTNFFGSISNVLTGTTTYTTYAIYGAIMVCFLFKYRLSGRQFYFFLILTSLLLGLLLLNRVIFVKSYAYFYMNKEVLYRILVFYYPIAYAMAWIDDYSHFFKYMRYNAFWTPFLCWVSLTYFELGKIINYMHISNLLLPGFLAAWYIARVKKKKLYYASAFFSLYLQLLYGGRMSFASGIVFIILLEVLLLSKEKTAKGIMKVAFLFMLTILGYAYYEQVIGLIISFLESLNLESRTLKNILEGTIFESKTRDIIYQRAWYEMKNMGVSMYGLFGDRISLEKYNPMHGYTTNYVHNIFFELILSFGWFIGGVISVWLIYKIIKYVFFEKDYEKRLMSVFFVCLIFMRLLVSGSFLIEGQFLFMIGIFFSRTSSNYSNNKLAEK